MSGEGWIFIYGALTGLAAGFVMFRGWRSWKGLW